MRTRSALKNDARWLLAALVTLLAAAPLRAHADPGNSVVIPFDPAVLDACNDDVVVLSGSMHGVAHMTFDGAGGVHVDEEMNLQGVSGQDSLGNGYNFITNTSTSMNGKVGVEATSTESFELIGQGSVPNMNGHFVFHMTVHPDGTMTSYVSDMSVTCN